MSEYQYYEFRAIDRPLTSKEMAELRAVSSRGQISATSYVNEYHFGDFKGNPDQWMERYFDAFVYYANWGTKSFKLRLPESLLPEDVYSPYCQGPTLCATSNGGYTILNYDLDLVIEDPSEDWEDGSGVLGSLIGLRAELARGDLRGLYLGWLISRDFEYAEGCEENDELEPPVPAGLQDLTESQKHFVEFFEIDQDLLAAAASDSPPLASAKRNPQDVRQWLASLPVKEKDAYLMRVFDGEGAWVGAEMEARFQNHAGPVSNSPRRRSHGELQTLRLTIREARRESERAREAEAKRKRLDDLAKRLPNVWDQVERHMESKKVNEYDEAVRLLRQIKELADAGGVPDFAARMSAIRARHTTKKALLERLRVF